jgi:hypothetical protein
VRITAGARTVFAGGIHNPKLGGSGMVYTFPKAGEYALSVRFQNNDDIVAEAEFPLTVEQNPNNAGSSGGVSIPVLVLILTGGLLGGFLFRTLSRNKK